jgi:hypothetical protein
MIVLRSPKGFWWAHQIPITDVRTKPRALSGTGVVDAQLQA